MKNTLSRYTQPRYCCRLREWRLFTARRDIPRRSKAATLFLRQKAGDSVRNRTVFNVCGADIRRRKLKKAKYPVMISSLILLALVFVPKLGVESFGAKRWINLGFFTIQPSEYAKFGFVIFAAAVCADDNVNNTKTLLKILFFGVFSCILIILEPNMSITVCLGAVMLVMLYVGGLKTKKFAAVLAPAVLQSPCLSLPSRTV